MPPLRIISKKILSPLRLRLLPTSDRFRQNNSARALRKASSFWLTITSRAFIRLNFAIINNLYRFGTQWAHSSDSATAEKRLKKIRSRIKNYTRAIVSSPEIVDIYAQAFGISNDKVIPVGTPRTDVFFDSDYVSSVKERLYKKQPLLKGKKVCLFAPTFRGQNVNDAEYPEEFINIEKFANSLGDDWAVILKMHPFIKKRLDIPQSVQNRVFDFSDEREINDILFITDVLVTDYSSVIFENAIVGNAAVLYAPDLADYDNGRGFYFDYKNYSCGKIVREQGDLAAAVLGANTTNDYYKAFKSRFVSMCDGNSTKRFVEKILEKE